jgi:hypothetical protein
MRRRVTLRGLQPRWNSNRPNKTVQITAGQCDGSLFLYEPIGDVSDACFNRQRKRNRSETAAPGFQIEIKESKTPGGEQYLDPPGAELLPWF